MTDNVQIAVCIFLFILGWAIGRASFYYDGKRRGYKKGYDEGYKEGLEISSDIILNKRRKP